MIGLGAIVMCLLATTSCKKDYTCNCSNGGTYSSGTAIKDAKKKDAEDACSQIETTAKMAYPSVSCSI